MVVAKFKHNRVPLVKARRNMYLVTLVAVFWATNRIKCYLTRILRQDLESSHHLAYLRTPFDMIFIL